MFFFSLCVIRAACSSGDIRLVGGNGDFEGRVEVCMDREWGTVCDDRWDNTDAQVVCRQAGFSDEGSQAVQARPLFGQGTGSIYLDDVECIGTEGRLVDCPFISNHNCGHFEDAGVICQGTIDNEKHYGA